MCKIIPCFQKLRVYPCYDNPNNIRSFPLYRKILMIYIHPVPVFKRVFLQ